MVSPSVTPTAQIVTMWMKTGRLLKDRMCSAHKECGVHPQQMFAAFMILENEGLTMKQLADALGITSPSATSMVNNLVKMKFVARLTDPKNRKFVRLKLAPEGKKMIQKVMSHQSKAMAGVLKLLDERDQQDFSRILTNLFNVLSASKK